jgi:NADPH:quinone reductase-like Zn-dependent oxidoreductase
MLAVQVSRHGGPAELQPVQLADPVAGRGEVLVRNRWIGVNYVDLQHREGQPYPVGLPLVPGTEAAGAEVIAVASSAAKVQAALDLGARHGFAGPDTPDLVNAVLSGITGAGRGACSLTLGKLLLEV